jgi:hypothetical protein
MAEMWSAPMEGSWLHGAIGLGASALPTGLHVANTARQASVWAVRLQAGVRTRTLCRNFILHRYILNSRTLFDDLFPRNIS